MGFRDLSFLPFLRLIGISEYIYIEKKLINHFLRNFERKENTNSRSCFRSLFFFTAWYSYYDPCLYDLGTTSSRGCI